MSAVLPFPTALRDFQRRAADRPRVVSAHDVIDAPGSANRAGAVLAVTSVLKHCREQGHAPATRDAAVRAAVTQVNNGACAVDAARVGIAHADKAHAAEVDRAFNVRIPRAELRAFERDIQFHGPGSDRSWKDDIR